MAHIPLRSALAQPFLGAAGKDSVRKACEKYCKLKFFFINWTKFSPLPVWNMLVGMASGKPGLTALITLALLYFKVMKRSGLFCQMLMRFIS